MRVEGRTVVVTGAGNGIGRAMAKRFAAEGAKAVVVSDFDETGMTEVADQLGAPRRRCDVGDADDLRSFIDWVEDDVGPIDLFCSNPAVFGGPEGPGLEQTEETLDRSWRVNVLSHIRTAQQLVPRMVERGGGYFLQTLSAAALVTGRPMAYTVTKHAGLGFAEWLVLNHGRQGIKVSCLCPTAVETRPGQFDQAPEIGLVQRPDEIADVVVKGLDAETFLILPNPAVGGSFRKKATDYDAWIRYTTERLAKMGR